MPTFQRDFGSNTAKCSFLRDGHKTGLWPKAGSERDEPLEIEGREEEHVEDEIEGGADISGEVIGQYINLKEDSYLVTKLWPKLRRRHQRLLSPPEKFWRASEPQTRQEQLRGQT